MYKYVQMPNMLYVDMLICEYVDKLILLRCPYFNMLKC